MRSARAILIFAASAVTLSAWACAPRPSLRGPAPLPPAYREELLAWTASGNLFQDFDRRIEAHATLFTPSFRQAFRSHFQQIFGYQPEQGKGELEKRFAKNAEHPAVFLAVDFSDWRWSDLSDPDAAWKVLLLQAAGGYTPAQVEALDVPEPNLRAFFPYVGEYSRCFWIGLTPASADEGAELPRGLLLTSTYGKVELLWKGGK